ncbi:hypothetical protein HII28_02565 [Planctomonas sp. JC2975]|uniref:trimeric intracellular cation channel family protein n=1 Tax=Planctomonas sp. JC2975 TaxID=2729626 RepID=UPI00147666E0|nr:TRIC cation channel family protein [Planctomonas sp. JC2975]NNC10767.1 hypothetical protein [Planctomonas sp. JC2975]
MTSTFSLPLWAELVAVAVGSVQGAAYASGFRDRRIDLLGVAIIGAVTGLGGGALRDILLATGLVALQTNWYLPVAVLSALAGMLLARLFHRIDWTITILDALTIGLFGAIGATKALSMGLPGVPAVFVGVVSAVGGSILRDILLGTPIGVMHVGSLYAVAAGAGTTVLVVGVELGLPIAPASIACTVVTMAVRLLAVRFGWSLPEQRTLSLRRPRISFARLGRRGPDARTASPRTGSIPTYREVKRTDDTEPPESGPAPF